MAKIKMHIEPDGTTTTEVDGVTGSSCQSLTKTIEEKLGPQTAQSLKLELEVEEE
jgi:hypothetical protein